MPERTDTFARFLSLEKNRKYVQKQVCGIIETCVYPWQEMRLWSLMTETDKLKENRLLSLARLRVRDDSYPDAPRAYATLFLGKYGNYQDRNFIANQVSASNSFFSTRCNLLAIQEHPEKKSIYNRFLNASSDVVIAALIKYLLQASKIEYVQSDTRITGELEFIS